MPLEPKKPIDELLEASAKARRAAFGADPKMPNPMRTQLHHEISRLARKDECESHLVFHGRGSQPQRLWFWFLLALRPFGGGGNTSPPEAKL